MKAARKRICRQAKEMQLYDDVIGASEKDLDPRFRQHFQEYLRPDHRGFGYYAWKPQIARQILRTMNEGDILHWIDAGCHLNPNGQWRLKDYFEMASSAPSGIHGFLCLPPNGSLFFEGRQFPNQAEYIWTKGDLLDRLKVRDKPDITETQQIGATTFFVRKCETSMSFMDEWIRTFEEDFSMIDNRPSLSPNMEGFIEHRWDQSIYSILGKLLPISTISVFECWYPSQVNCWSPDWEILKDYPIQIRRDRGIKPQSQLQLAVLKAKGRVKRMMTGLGGRQAPDHMDS